MEETKMICEDCVRCVKTTMQTKFGDEVKERPMYYCTLQSCDFLYGEKIIECNRYEKERDYDR